MRVNCKKKNFRWGWKGGVGSPCFVGRVEKDWCACGSAPMAIGDERSGDEGCVCVCAWHGCVSHTPVHSQCKCTGLRDNTARKTNRPSCCCLIFLLYFFFAIVREDCGRRKRTTGREWGGFAGNNSVSVCVCEGIDVREKEREREGGGENWSHVWEGRRVPRIIRDRFNSKPGGCGGGG